MGDRLTEKKISIELQTTLNGVQVPFHCNDHGEVLVQNSDHGQFWTRQTLIMANFEQGKLWSRPISNKANSDHGQF